jgi:hypothetical protein
MGRRRHEATPISTWARQCRDRWPLVARAQQPDRIRVIGVLVAGTADDPEHQARVEAFRQGLERLGCRRPGKFLS